MKVLLILFLVVASLLAIATLVYVIMDMIREQKANKPAPTVEEKAEEPIED